MRTLVVFEDSATQAFDVLTSVRAVFDLRCGAQTLLGRIRSRTSHERLVLLPMPNRATLAAEMHPGADVGWSDAAAATNQDFLFVNGRLLVLGRDLEALTQVCPKGGAVCVGATVVVARGESAMAERIADALSGDQTGAGAVKQALQTLGNVQSVDTLASVAPDGSQLLEHVWQLVQNNSAALLDDFAHGPGAGVSVGARIDPGVHLMNDANIRLEEGVRLRPGVVLDAEDGPITLAAGVDVQPNVVVRGPVWIGPDCLLKAGAKIHEGTSAGPVCKLGGEIEGSILQAYSNKQHEGFLGHAYLGEWVNFGADTNNSDLKNNYGNVRMWEAGAFVDTGTMFMGLVAADHVKSAINTQFNTGTVVGFSSQVFGAGFPPKYIAPFSWGTTGDLYDLERALETARTVMARRQRNLTPAYEAALRSAHERARAARAAAGK